MSQKTLFLPDYLDPWLDARAKKEGLSKTRVMVDAIAHYLGAVPIGSKVKQEDSATWPLKIMGTEACGDCVQGKHNCQTGTLLMLSVDDKAKTRTEWYCRCKECAPTSWPGLFG